jgi:prepilin-type N-terminal cleavage/methylation domain-containing protein
MEYIEKIFKRERGFTLIEVIVAMGIMAAVIIIFLIAMATTGKALLIAQEHTIAESLGRSQMEYIKDQGYQSGNYELIDLTDYPNFSIWSVSGWDGGGEALAVAGAVGIEWDMDNNTAATGVTGLQRVILLIKHGDKDVLTLEGYIADY